MKQLPLMALPLLLGACHLLVPYDPGGPDTAPPADDLRRDQPAVQEQRSLDRARPRDRELVADATVADAPPVDRPGCTHGQLQGCTVAGRKGPCAKGQRKCSKGKWGQCLPTQSAVPESCDNQDNDCDGKIDGFGQPCYTGQPGTRGKGECKDGTKTCTAGSWGSCKGQTLPVVETCDGKDNDCNGIGDDVACYPSSADGCKKQSDGSYKCKGLCKTGFAVCQGTKPSTCTGYTLPMAESCDTQNNDCDDDTDEGALCATGQSCISGQCK